MSYTTDVRRQMEQVEYQKFVEFAPNDSAFPAVSVVKWEYADSSTAAVSSMYIYPKTGVITIDASTVQTNGSPFGDNSSVDSFGRLRVTEPTTLLDSKALYNKNDYVFDEALSGTATSTFSAFDSCVDMRTVANGDYVIRQTRVRYNYQPGKGMQYMFTGLFHPQPNIIKRVGCFQSLTAAPYEPSDGIFLEVTGNGPAFRIIKTQGTPHTNYAPQSAWNIDRLDGTGPSGITIDFTKAVLFTIDFEWLSVGRVRFGFFYNGRCYYAHADSHGGELTAPYMTFSNQPVRYEIRQTGAGSGLMRHICSTVLIEGSTENVGRVIAVEDSAVTVQAGVFTPLLSIQLDPRYRNALVIVKDIQVLNASNPGKSIQYALFLNPLITGGSLSFSPVANSFMLSAAGNSGLSVTQGISGYKMLAGFAATGQGSQGTTESGNNFSSDLARFGTTINGAPDTMVLAAKGVGDSANNIYGVMNLLEKA